MIIRVNPEYSYILKRIVEYYTQFSFTEFQSLKSKYSRILMPKLTQWNSIKKLEIQKEELFTILGVPQSYIKDISNFNKKVIKPLKEDLPKVFYNLKIKTIKKSTANSKNEINSYMFSWSNKPKENIKTVEEVKTLEISKKDTVIGTKEKKLTNKQLELIKEYKKGKSIYNLSQLARLINVSRPFIYKKLRELDTAN